MTYAIAVGPALVVGFVLGLFTFRQKSRWCPTCGATFTCPDRSSHAGITAGDHTGRAFPGEPDALRPANRGTHFSGRRPVRDGEG